MDSETAQQAARVQAPQIRVEDDTNADNDSSDGEMYLNCSIVQDSEAVESQEEPAPKPVPEPDSASSNSGCGGISKGGLPVIRIEINRMVYTIGRADIAITTEGGVASLSLSLEVGGATQSVTDAKSSSYVKSIKTSFKSSKRALLGAATKLFGSHSSTTGKVGEALADDEAGDSDLQRPQQQLGGDNCDAEASGGLGTESSGRNTGGSDIERYRRTVSSSQDNTVESDAGQKLQQQSSSEEASSMVSASIAGKAKTLKNMFKMQHKSASHGGASSTSEADFPDCMPDKVKAYFEVTSDTRLITTIYAADTESISDEVKQTKKSLLEDPPAKSKVKVDGKARSVWLSPTAGERLEVWKLYYDSDDKCQKVLGRLAGTNLYGYILPQEIDRNKQFSSPTEQAAYDRALRCLAFLDQDEYDVEQLQQQSPAPEEIAGEVYM